MRQPADPGSVLSAQRTGIVLDSTADLSPEQAASFDMRVVPLTLTLDGREYRDRVDLDPDAFYALLARGQSTPTTAAPSPHAFAQAYEAELAAGREHVLSLHLPGRLSATVQAARLAAEGFGGRVTVYDTGSVSLGTALCALAVRERVQAGTTLGEIAAYVEGFAARSRLLFSVDTLEYLRRGGRLGAAQALVGGLLSLRPILTLHEGQVAAIGRARGRSKLFAAIGEQLERSTSRDGPLRVAIAHADAPHTARELAALARRVRPGSTLELVAPLGPVLGTYGGPGAFGMVWVPEPPTSARAEPPSAETAS